LGAAVLPLGLEHEVLHEELAVLAEQVGQPGLAVGAVEDVVLLDAHHAELAAAALDQLVAGPGERLLLGQQLRAAVQPLLAGDHGGKRTHRLTRTAPRMNGCTRQKYV
jgi:hypothetical protein